MESRFDYFHTAPELFKALYALQNAVNHASLPQELQELVKMRASQLNGCALCIALHLAEARRLGIADEKLHLLNAWRETPLFDARERAALAWTEALTLVTEGHVADAVYEQVRAQFSDQELVELSFAVTTINTWNRLCVPFQAIHPTPAAKAA